MALSCDSFRKIPGRPGERERERERDRKNGVHSRIFHFFPVIFCQCCNIVRQSFISIFLLKKRDKILCI